MGNISRAETAPMRDKLCHLYEYLKNPRGGAYTYEYADFLASRFPMDSVSPEQFLLIANLTFIELEKGIDAYTGEPIRHRAADRVSSVAVFIKMDMPSIIDAVFPPDFATIVHRVQEMVDQEVRLLQNSDDTKAD